MLTTASYLQHHNPATFKDPEEFRPERWMGKTESDFGQHAWFPFGKGRYSCSGQHLAMLEIPTLIRTLLREHHVQLLDPLPEPDWGYVVASVRPKGWPSKVVCNVTFARRVRPPVVKPTVLLRDDPVKFICSEAAKHGDIYTIARRVPYHVVVDRSLWEDVLTEDDRFGNPVTENMSVNARVFGVPPGVLAVHESAVIRELRKVILRGADEMTALVVRSFEGLTESALGSSATVDVRDLGELVFWAMTDALFGAPQAEHPRMYDHFEVIDNNLGKVLSGKRVPEVEAAVTAAAKVFESASAPVVDTYKRLVSAEAAPRFAAAAWWGAQGNSVPGSAWTFAMALSDAAIRERLFKESHTSSTDFATACFKETLRLKTYSIAWRTSQFRQALSVKNRSYTIEKGELLGVHFCVAHNDESLWPNPHVFDPRRFVDGNGPKDRYAWTPFSAGMHKCAGYALAMAEIPALLLSLVKRYDIQVIDELPGDDNSLSFGVVGMAPGSCRVKLTRRSSSKL